MLEFCHKFSSCINAGVMDQLWDAFSGTATSCEVNNFPKVYDSNGGSDLGVAKGESCQSESVATIKKEKKTKERRCTSHRRCV